MKTALAATVAMICSASHAEASCRRSVPAPDLCPSGSQMACTDDLWNKGFVCLDPQDFTKGYCVELSDELKATNAIVTVIGSMLNGQERIFEPRNRDFFRPDSFERSLQTVDWGGTMTLMKLNNNFDGSFNAEYQNRLHGNEVDPVTVRCISDASLEASNETDTPGEYCEPAPENSFCGQW